MGRKSGRKSNKGRNFTRSTILSPTASPVQTQPQPQPQPSPTAKTRNSVKHSVPPSPRTITESCVQQRGEYIPSHGREQVRAPWKRQNGASEKEIIDYLQVLAYRYRDLKEANAEKESSEQTIGNKIVETSVTANVGCEGRTSNDGWCGNPPHVEPDNKTRNAVFVWNATLASQVFVCGSFNSWTAVPMTREGTQFRLNLQLEPGEHSYKFMVDGNWWYDIRLPNAPDAAGNVNNVLAL